MNFKNYTGNYLYLLTLFGNSELNFNKFLLKNYSFFAFVDCGKCFESHNDKN